MTTRSDRYSEVAIALHWTIAALIIFNLATGILHDGLPKDWAVIPLHKTLGIIVLALTFVRIGWRLVNAPPAWPATMSKLEIGVARATHAVLYLLMVAVPFSGWMMSSNPERPRPVSMFGLFDMPLLPSTPALSGGAHEAHEVIGYAMAALVVLHIAAALRHQWILRDRLMLRMMPARRAQG